MRKRIESIVLIFALVFSFILPFSSPTAKADSNIIRYTVLVLDTSGSANFLDENGDIFYTADTAINYVKQAASKFLDDILNASGTNYVSVVSFKDSAEVVSDFSNNATSLKNKINNLYSGGNRSISTGLSKANDLLSTVSDSSNVKKNVVLFTTGMTNVGAYSYEGKYDSNTIASGWRNTSTNVRLYAYANHAISVADELKKQANVYTLGLFRTFDNMPDYGKDVVDFFKLTAKDLATSESYFYQVDDPNDIEFAFGDIAEDINTRDIPVIIVPGVMGSNLYSSKDCKDESLVWLPPYQSWDEIKESFDIIISLGERMDVSKTLYVKEPVNLVKSTDREYGARDEYKKLVDSLCDNFVNGEVYFFSYDWRLSNVSNGVKLNNFIESLNVEKVNLVCHSMGGLVASCYVSSYGTDNINKVITCGTPYEGSPAMINKLQNWDLLDDNKSSVNLNDLIDSGLGLFAGLTKSFKKSLPSVAELFPTKDYVTAIPMYEDSWVPANYGDKQISTDRYVEICNKILSKNSYNNAIVTHNFITSKNGNYGVLADFEETYFIVGTGKPTISSIKFQFVGNDIDETIYESGINYSIKGDGTVPYVSATMNEYLINNNSHFIPLDDTDHGGTAYGSKGINTILNILKNNEISQEPIKDKNYMVIIIACPVDVTIECNNDVLSSSFDNLNIKSEFGRLDLLGENNEIKMVCIENTDIYDVLLEGTDTGTMDYSISWFNYDDELLSTKSFSDVSITNDTVINTKTDSDDIVLNVDNNGDGIVDEIIKPDVNSENCDCKCHQGGIAGFFFKIVLFFQKLFGKNLECICGAKH